MFKDPNELMELFTQLEEQNLFLIECCQNFEQQLEEKRQTRKNIEEVQNKQINTLKSNEQNNLDRIHKITKERDALKNISEENESTKLDRATQEKLFEEIHKMYVVAKEIKHKDMVFSYDSANPLAWIEDCENIMNNF